MTGEMQEWLNWHAWKACVLQKGTGGSNPPLSAIESAISTLCSLTGAEQGSEKGFDSPYGSKSKLWLLFCGLVIGAVYFDYIQIINKKER